MSAVRENRQDSRLQGDTQNLDIRQVTQKTIELRLGRVILGEYLLLPDEIATARMMISIIPRTLLPFYRAGALHS